MFILLKKWFFIKYSKTIVFIIITIVLIITSCKQSSNELIIKNWSITYNQEKSIDLIQKSSNWKPVDITSFFSHPYKAILDYQYMWLKSEFIIPESPEDYYGICIGPIYYLDTIYINNQIISQTLADDQLSIHIPRIYKIPSNVLRKGKNEIFIYLGIYGRQLGGISGDVKICNKETYKSIKSWYMFLYYDLSISLIVFIFFQTIFLVIFFLWNRKEKAILFSILFCISSMIYLLLDSLNILLCDHNLRLTLQYYIAMIIQITNIFLIQSLYNIYMKTINRTIIVYFVIITILSFLDIDTTSDNYFVVHLNGINSILTFVLDIYILYRVNTLKKDIIKLTLLIIFTFIPIISIIFVLINAMQSKFYNTFYYNYYIPFVIIGFIIILIRETIIKEKNIKDQIVNY